MALSRGSLRTLRALGETMFPALDGEPSGGEIVPEAADRFVSTLDPAAQRQLGVVLGLFELSAVARYGRPFSRLDPDARVRWLEGWMTSRLPVRRIVYRSLKGLCAIVYYQDARTWPLFGYDGPLVAGGRTR
jgi:hypothetical protein